MRITAFLGKPPDDVEAAIPRMCLGLSPEMFAWEVILPRWRRLTQPQATVNRPDHIFFRYEHWLKLTCRAGSRPIFPFDTTHL